MVNPEACALLAKQLEELGERHSQLTWFGIIRDFDLAEFHACGTTACAAGLYAVNNAPLGTQYIAQAEALRFPDGRSVWIVDWVGDELELSYPQRPLIFACASRWRVIRRLQFLAANPDCSAAELKAVD